MYSDLLQFLQKLDKTDKVSNDDVFSAKMDAKVFLLFLSKSNRKITNTKTYTNAKKTLFDR